MGTAERARDAQRRVGQVEISAGFVEAMRGGNPAEFGAPIAHAPTVGPFRNLQKEPEDEEATALGAISITAVPNSWGLVSISQVMIGTELPVGDVMLTVGKLGDISATDLLLEDVGSIETGNDGIEVEILEAVEPYRYSDDMGAVPVLWGRTHTAEEDTMNGDLIVIGHTFRRVD